MGLLGKSDAALLIKFKNINQSQLDRNRSLSPKDFVEVIWLGNKKSPALLNSSSLKVSVPDTAGFFSWQNIPRWLTIWRDVSTEQ